MVEIKNHTSLEQSKTLAEFLSLESADMHYNNVSIKGINYVDKHRPELMEYNKAIKVLSKYTINPLFEVIPCWSLGALINLLPSSLKDEIGMEFHLSMHKDYIEYVNSNVSGLYSTYIHTCGNNNLVDACYEMIIKLHEQKLL